eukprot:376530-Amorphochlora_amoeboformis.AAC.1
MKHGRVKSYSDWPGPLGIRVESNGGVEKCMEIGPMVANGIGLEQGFLTLEGTARWSEGHTKRKNTPEKHSYTRTPASQGLGRRFAPKA